MYCREFFDLQLRFAFKLAALTGQSIEESLLNYTNLYVRFGLGRDFDPENPVWRSYVKGLSGRDALDWTYEFYSRAPDTGTPEMAATSGCFSYSVLKDGRLRLHFKNVDSESPLSSSRVNLRRTELAALFTRAKQDFPDETPVVGASWLYNIDAYRRLFPASFLATAQPLENKFRNVPLWGQLLDWRGQVKASMAEPFLCQLEALEDADSAADCFQYRVLSVQGPLAEFSPQPLHTMVSS